MHLGKPILAMLVVAIVSGGVVVLRPAPPRSDLSLWTFADVHARVYRPLKPDFERSTGHSLDIHVIAERALSERLTSLFLFGRTGADLPDAVEINLGQIGKFFAPPPDAVGFLPLNGYLQRPGLPRIPASRFAPWTKQGFIFGVPRDVHPVTITYRADLFAEAGVPIEQAATWPQFHEMALQFRRYWAGRGVSRYALELQESYHEHLVVMLLQRGVNVVDETGAVHLHDPKVAQTLTFYAGMIAGERRVAAESAGRSGLWVRDLAEGNVCAFITPDWKIDDLRRFAPEAPGKLRMMPLPRFDPSDRPTSTWGGTMIGIPRHARDPEAAWKLIEYFYLSERAVDARMEGATPTYILPPIEDYWSKPIFQEPDPYFGGQKVRALYVELAHQIPPQYVTPVTPLANGYLGYVLTLAAGRLKEDGRAGLEEYVGGLLKDAQADLERRVEHGRFE
jgi:arabinosaccharide transport system substrate-binding protein